MSTAHDYKYSLASCAWRSSLESRAPGRRALDATGDARATNEYTETVEYNSTRGAENHEYERDVRDLTEIPCVERFSG